MTLTEALSIARAFVYDYINTDRQWDMETLAAYLPEGKRFRAGAMYGGSCTIRSIADFLRWETTSA